MDIGENRTNTDVMKKMKMKRQVLRKDDRTCKLQLSKMRCAYQAAVVDGVVILGNLCPGVTEENL
jgi:hypothetical protein